MTSPAHGEREPERLSSFEPLGPQPSNPTLAAKRWANDKTFREKVRARTIQIYQGWIVDRGPDFLLSRDLGADSQDRLILEAAEQHAMLLERYAAEEL